MKNLSKDKDFDNMENFDDEDIDPNFSQEKKLLD